MKDDDVLRAELARHFAERWQEGVAIMIKLYGGLEAYRAACLAKRYATPDHRLARIICRALRERRRPNERNQQILDADRPLAAYFASVDASGAAGWREERARVVA